MSVRRAVRVTVLSLRISRTELVVASVAAIALGVGVAAATALLRGAEVPTGCFSAEGDPTCRSSLASFYEIADKTVWLRGVGAGLLAPLMGLILGVPIVARELETRTASLAWSLTGSRSVWLLHRALPVVAAAAIGLAILAVLESAFHETVGAGRPGSVDDLGGYGITFVARGALALGIGVLAGAIVGRSYVAFIVAGAITLLLVTVGVVSFRTVVAERMSVWQELPYVASEHDFASPEASLFEFEEVFRLSDGTMLDYDGFFGNLYERVAETEDRPEEWLAQNAVRLVRAVPADRLPDFEILEASVAFGIGAGAFLLSFPVVLRRRPPT